MDRDTRKLIASLESLTGENKKLASFWNNFLRGLVFGLGSAIGASVIAAVAIGIISRFSESIKNLYFK